MKKIRIKHTDLEVSNLVMGCMRIGELSEKELEELTETYLSEGVNFFDHADIYGGGALVNKNWTQILNITSV